MFEPVESNVGNLKSKCRKQKVEVRKINNTKIKYLQVEDKLYEVTKISFFSMEIEAVEMDLAVDDVCEDELWGIGEFRNYKVRLTNGSGKAEIVDFSEWKSRKQAMKPLFQVIEKLPYMLGVFCIIKINFEII